MLEWESIAEAALRARVAQGEARPAAALTVPVERTHHGKKSVETGA